MKPFKIVLNFLIILIFFTSSLYTQNNQGKTDKLKAKKVWEIQAKSIAKEFSLSTEKTAELITVYIAARESLKDAYKTMPEENDAAKKKAAKNALKDVERKKLEKSLMDILSKEQLTVAMKSLGSFNPRWDRFVRIIVGFKMDEVKYDAALIEVNKYITSYQEAYQEAAQKGERFSGKKSRELKETLDNGLSVILLENQLVEWKSASALGKKKAQ